MNDTPHNFDTVWHPTSGHPGGWRVVRGDCPLEEHNGPSGRRILFRTMEAAQRRADFLNGVEDDAQLRRLMRQGGDPLNAIYNGRRSQL